MPDNPRIEELRRRVQKDPTSIAFAQLAEEYRRAGHFAEAIETCRTGLARHPGYLSARVTLGRSLLETGDLQEGETELQQVLKTAPENLAAIRGLAEIYRRKGALAEALGYYENALRLARHDPDLEQAVDDIRRTVEPSVRRQAEDHGGMSFEQAQAEFLTASASAPPPPPEAPAPAQSSRADVPGPVAQPGDPEARALPGLQDFLSAIIAHRQQNGLA